MREFLNQNSYVFLGLIIVVLSSLLLVRINLPFSKIFIFVGILAIIFSIGISLRNGNSSISSTGEVKATLHGGEPTVVMFYSDYWILCLSIKPVVNRLERSLNGQAKLIRLNLRESVGRELWDVHSLSVVPAFVVFDSKGREVWRQEGQYPDTHMIIKMAGSGQIH